MADNKYLTLGGLVAVAAGVVITSGDCNDVISFIKYLPAAFFLVVLWYAPGVVAVMVLTDRASNKFIRFILFVVSSAAVSLFYWFFATRFL